MNYAYLASKKRCARFDLQFSPSAEKDSLNVKHFKSSMNETYEKAQDAMTCVFNESNVFLVVLYFLYFNDEKFNTDS